MSSLESSSAALGHFARHARAGAVMTLVGALIVAGSLVYSGRQLAVLQSERTARETELSNLRHQLKEITESRAQAQAELEHVHAQVRSTRESLTSLQPCLTLFFARSYLGAVECYDKAISIDPANPVNYVLYDLKGYSLLRAGQKEDSVKALEKSVLLAPDYVWGHYNLALAYWATQRHDLAILEVEKVLSIDPSFGDIIRRDGQFNKFRSSHEFQRILAVS